MTLALTAAFITLTGSTDPVDETLADASLSLILTASGTKLDEAISEEIAADRILVTSVVPEDIADAAASASSTVLPDTDDVEVTFPEAAAFITVNLPLTVAPTVYVSSALADVPADPVTVASML